MFTGEQEEIRKLIAAIQGALMCKPAEEVVMPDSIDCVELLELCSKVNMLIANLSEANRFASELCKGNIDADPPGRRNYLASYLKELHTQLSSLAWSMEQLVAGHVVGKLTYNGSLFKAYNSLVEKIASISFSTEENVGSTWDWSVNSWRYHQLLSALNNLHIMVMEVDADGSIIYANRPARDYLAGRESLSGFLDLKKDALLSHLSACIEGISDFPLFREVFDEEKRAWYKITSDRVEFVDGRTGFLHMVDDISEWKKHEKTLKTTASYDSLTGVYNRRMGMKAFEEIVSSMTEPGYCAAFIDIDGLKFINDTYGHTAGDYVIKTIAGVLSSLARTNDIVCRYGGDEFFIVLKNCDRDEAIKIIRRMKRKLVTINRNSPMPYHMSFSHGLLSVQAGESTTTNEIIERMDHIMYKNKRLKKQRMSNKSQKADSQTSDNSRQL